MRSVFVSTNLQRVLGFLAEHPDQSYFVKEISHLASISYGGASEALATFMPSDSSPASNGASWSSTPLIPATPSSDIIRSSSPSLT